jgi:hypothetical protein
MSIDLSAQRQYLQRAVNVKYSFSDTTQVTLYTAPNGGDDYTFAILLGVFACDTGNQQTNLDISIVDTNNNECFLYKNHNIQAYGTEELIVNSGLILQEGEAIKAQVNHANIDIFLSIVEYAKGN